MYSNRLALLKEPCSISEASQIVAAKRGKKDQKQNTFAVPEKLDCGGVVMGKWCINVIPGENKLCNCPRKNVAD